MLVNLDIVYKFLETVGITQENRTVNRDGIDFAKATRLLSPDFIILNPLFHPRHGLIERVGNSADGALSGPAGWVEDIKATAPYFSFSVSDFALHDASDVTILRATIRIRGVRTGRTVETPFTELFFVKDGLIRRIEPYFNLNALHGII